MSETYQNKSYPSQATAWYTVFILMLAFTVSFIDRQILSLMVDPIKTDLSVGEFQISLLHGLAFVIFYTLFGFPLGRLADKRNRKIIIIIGVFVWSAMTFVCGLASSFIYLFLARVGVGIGEASLTPAAHSMITDSFPEEKRSLPLSIYSYGIFLGVGLAFIFGGLIVGWADQLNTISVPVIGLVKPWQLTFFLCALLGVPILLLLLTCKEPARNDLSSQPDSSNIQPPSLHQVFDFLNSRRRIYISLIAAFSFNAVIFYGLLAWVPSHFIRTFKFSAIQFGLPFGIIIIAVGFIAMFCAGNIADRMVSRGKKHVYEKLTLISLILALPSTVVSTLLPSPELTFFALGLTILFISVPIALAPAALHSITPNQMRGVVTALYLFLVNVIGLGFGPSFIASITQYGFEDVNKVGYAISISASIFLPLSICTLIFGYFRSNNR